jgi:Holliday junction resolvase-like predicted endonuclease
MTDTRKCPKCGTRMAFSNRRNKGGLVVKRRVCECGHVDAIHLREVIVEIVEIRRRGRTRQTPAA